MAQRQSLSQYVLPRWRRRCGCCSAPLARVQVARLHSRAPTSCCCCGGGGLRAWRLRSVARQRVSGAATKGAAEGERPAKTKARTLDCSGCNNTTNMLFNMHLYECACVQCARAIDQLSMAHPSARSRLGPLDRPNGRTITHAALTHRHNTCFIAIHTIHSDCNMIPAVCGQFVCNEAERSPTAAPSAVRTPPSVPLSVRPHCTRTTHSDACMHELCIIDSGARCLRAPRTLPRPRTTVTHHSDAPPLPLRVSAL